MTNDTGASAPPLLPKYYLVHPTPAGLRYAFPVPTKSDMPTSGFVDNQQERSWTAVDEDGDPFDVEYVPPARSNSWAEADYRSGWLICDRLPIAFELHWTTPSYEHGEWRKRSELRIDDPVVVARWKLSTDAPDDDTRTHLDHDYDHREGCLTCQVAHHVYERPKLPPTEHSYRVVMADWAPLPGEPDPNPQRDWRLDTRAEVSVFGRHTAHMWPGTLDGFRTAVVNALKAHPLSRDVYSSDRGGKVTVFWRIPWDVPQRLRDRDWISGHRELVVPHRLSARTKAEALEAWDRKVAEWVAKFVPADGEARSCTACSGRGYNLVRSES